ncbi:Haloacid dehalogenase-like hydrolase domain-containing protein [Camellia lanceoleosa]|uniref:Haloacid dehalogenase-like hydrolase domain-containing protein n=1 Tax=Camellia lanceoleosa TaxID=1840588 RepID=A0ACC0I8U0_9ERIC|nr:Haloacid dehalogenase-like hydrolase domain-containing protein [Camellia lanceoleosa]
MDWKTERYKEIIRSRTVEPRPGVLRLMDEAKDAGKSSDLLQLKVLLCSTLRTLLELSTSKIWIASLEVESI